jgi:hypothetical protein
MPTACTSSFLGLRRNPYLGLAAIDLEHQPARSVCSNDGIVFIRKGKGLQVACCETRRYDAIAMTMQQRLDERLTDQSCAVISASMAGQHA